MKPLHPWRRAAGLSLIELLIALAIGSLLVLGLVEVFAASRTAYQLSTGLARVQENGRFALDFMQRDIRMAGHLGCVNDQARFLPGNVTPSRPALASTFLTKDEQQAADYTGSGVLADSLRFDIGLEGFDAKIGGSGAATASGSTITLAATPLEAAGGAAWEPAISTGLFNDLVNPVQNSDVIVLRYFTATGAQMKTFKPGSSAEITFEPSQSNRLTDGVTNPGLFGISDCINAAVFEATAPISGGLIKVNISGANNSGLLGNQSFVPGQAIVYRAESIVYYVGINTSGNPALYRLRYTLTPGAALPTPINEELVEGIESLQLQYGQDSRTAANELPTGNIGSSVIANALLPAADPVTAWRRVGLVQIGMVARSPDPAAAAQRSSAAAPLSALGVRVTPPDDTRYRTVYEDSIALRNRLFGN